DQHGGLTRDRASLTLECASRRVGRELLTALDERRVHAPAHEQRVGRIRTKAPIELLDSDENAPHLRDRVDPQVRARAVRRPARRLDLEVNETAMSDR